MFSIYKIYFPELGRKSARYILQAVIGITFSSAKCARQNGKYAIDWKMRQQFKNQPFPQHDVHGDCPIFNDFILCLSFGH